VIRLDYSVADRKIDHRQIDIEFELVGLGDEFETAFYRYLLERVEFAIGVARGKVFRVRLRTPTGA